MIGVTVNWPDGKVTDDWLVAEVIAGVVSLRLVEHGAVIEADEIQTNGELFFASHPEAA